MQLVGSLSLSFNLYTHTLCLTQLAVKSECHEQSRFIDALRLEDALLAKEFYELVSSPEGMTAILALCRRDGDKKAAEWVLNLIDEV